MGLSPIEGSNPSLSATSLCNLLYLFMIYVICKLAIITDVTQSCSWRGVARSPEAIPRVPRSCDEVAIMPSIGVTGMTAPARRQDR